MRKGSAGRYQRQQPRIPRQEGVSGGAMAQAGSSAAAAAVSYAPRLAGPPLPLTDLTAWTFVSLASYLCFIYLPGRLTRSIHRRLNPLAAQDDLAWAANHLHLSLWWWAIYDLVWRAFALACLPRWELIKMGFFASGGDNADDSGASGNGSWLTAFESIRVLIGADSLFTGPTARKDALPAVIPQKILVIVVSCTCVVLLLWATYWLHARKVLRARAVIKAQGLGEPAPYPAKLQELPELEDAKRKKAFDEHHRLYNYAEDSVFPTVSCMCLWSIGYCTLFAWVRAMPILMQQLYPGAVCLLVAYSLFLPS